MIGSLGMGKQQRAYVTSSPSVPAIIRGPLLALVFALARGLQVPRDQRREPLAESDFLEELVGILEIELLHHGVDVAPRVSSSS